MASKLPQLKAVYNEGNAYSGQLSLSKVSLYSVDLTEAFPPLGGWQRSPFEHRTRDSNRIEALPHVQRCAKRVGQEFLCPSQYPQPFCTLAI
jgi:hypothetical protein